MSWGRIAEYWSRVSPIPSEGNEWGSLGDEREGRIDESRSSDSGRNRRFILDEAI